MSNFRAILIVLILQPVYCNLVLGQPLSVGPQTHRVPVNPLGGNGTWDNGGATDFFGASFQNPPYPTESSTPPLPQGVTASDVRLSTQGGGFFSLISITPAYLNGVTQDHDIPVTWVDTNGDRVTVTLQIRLGSQQQSQTQTQTQTQTQQQWGQMQGRSRIRNDRGSVCILKTRFNPSSGKVEVIRNGVIRHNGFLNFTDKTRLNRRQKLRAYR